MKILNIPEIGEVKIVKSRKARRFTLRIGHDSQIRATIPYYSSYNEAINIIMEKTDWISKNRRNRAKYDENYPLKNHKIRIIRSNPDNPFAEIKKGEIILHCSDDHDVYHPAIQEILKTNVQSVLKSEAVPLVTRTRLLAKRHGFSHGNISLRNQKTRWGSCSYHNNISLNVRLTQLDQDLVDYVILHELCHTVVKNHGKDFWSLLEKVFPDAKDARKRLRKVSL